MQPARYDSLSSLRPYPTGEDVVEAGTDPVRAWIPDSPLLVLGNSQTPEIELDLEAARADGIPMYQRKGGGGAVYLTDGCVCLALRFRRNPEWAIRDYFEAGNGVLASAFGEAFGIPLAQRGISDLAYVEERHGRWEERKVAGSSLYMPRDSAVYLASVLVDADLGALDRYLRHPSREPDYRDKRSHADFVVNLAGIPGPRRTDVTPRAALAALEESARRPGLRGALDAPA
jgi:lipoate-protein ligase A